MTARSEPSIDASFWQLTPKDAFDHLGSRPSGLSSAEAEIRRARFGPNTIEGSRRAGPLWLLARQFESPIILILVVATPARLTWPSPASKVDRAHGRPAARIGARSRRRIRDTGDRYPLVIELVRATVLVGLAVLAITVVFPALLELAAATSFPGH